MAISSLFALRSANPMIHRSSFSFFSMFHSSTSSLSDSPIEKVEVPAADHHFPKRRHTDFDGIVVSDKMQKSIVVAVTRFRLNEKYNKRQRYTKRFMAHDEEEVCEIGDKVRITMSRPISKKKAFKFLLMLEKVKKI